MRDATVAVSVFASVVATICVGSSEALVSLILVLFGCAVSWGGRGLVIASWLRCAMAFGANLYHRSQAEDRARASDAWWACLRSFPPIEPMCSGDGGCMPGVIAHPDTSACDAARDRMREAW